jgi:hypothetical protein
MPEKASLLTEFFVGSGLSAALAGYLVSFLHKKKIEIEKQKENQSVSAVIDAATIYDELNTLASRTGCMRALILASSNGGGIPDAGSPLTVSILYEVVRGEGLMPIRGDWQMIPLDEAYVSMLRELINAGTYHGDLDKLKPGMLKDLYDSEGVKSFYIVPILRTQLKYYFLSIRWNEEKEVNESTIRTCLTAASHRIEEILKASVKSKKA